MPPLSSIIGLLLTRTNKNIELIKLGKNKKSNNSTPKRGYSVNSNNNNELAKKISLERLQLQKLRNNQIKLNSQMVILNEFKNNLFDRIKNKTLSELDILEYFKLVISKILQNNRLINRIINNIKPSNNKNILEELLNVKDENNKTLLQYAVERNFDEIESFLLKLNINILDKQIEQVLESKNLSNFSILKDNIKKLLLKGYKINKIDEFINKAFGQSKFELLKYLIEIKFGIMDLFKFPQSKAINYTKESQLTQNIRAYMVSLQKNNGIIFAKFIIFMKQLNNARANKTNIKFRQQLYGSDELRIIIEASKSK